MRRQILSACVFLLALCPAASAAVRGWYTVSFQATTTLQSFSGTLPPVAFEAQPVPDPVSGKQTWNADLGVPVVEMTTENDHRDRTMNEMLDSATFPRITALLRNVDPDALHGAVGGGGAASQTLPFELTIRNVTQPIVGKVSNWEEGGGQATFEVDFDVSLAQFGLEPPTAFLYIHIDDRVAVHVAVSVRRD
jgi:polyisoprenoid-binding protein YceI